MHVSEVRKKTESGNGGEEKGPTKENTGREKKNAFGWIKTTQSQVNNKKSEQRQQREHRAVKVEVEKEERIYVREEKSA